MPDYAGPLSRLIEALERLPGLGPKSSQRIAFHIFRAPEDEVANLSEAISDVKHRVKYCGTCFNFTDEEQCSICTNPERDESTLCVVGEVQDLMALERMGEYKGVYHVLGGLIAPLDGIGPEDLHIKELLQRIGAGTVKEVILATNPVVEGDATAMYVHRLIKDLGDFRVTRIASGLPVGADMDYADQSTIARAVLGRREMD